jgi:hypothetical protein
MHAPAAPPQPQSDGLVEFAGFIQRYRIDLVLMRRHYLRLAVGLVASLVVLSYNAFHDHAVDEMQTRGLVADWMILVFLVLCLVIVTIRGWRLRAMLRRPPLNMRMSVMQVVDFVHHWGNLLLFLAAIGHGVLAFATTVGLDVFTRDGRVLLATLAPTLLLMLHGLTQLPTCERLCAIHAAAVAARED